MKRLALPLTTLIFSIVCFHSNAQDQPLKLLNVQHQKGARQLLPRCSTMEIMQQAIKRDPTLPEKWRLEGERQYKLYLERQHQVNMRAEEAQANTIIIPIVFHLVDEAASLDLISDRDVIEQVEILNKDYGGGKMDQYTNVIPPEIAARLGRVAIKFVLARRDPNGALTTGIERRANATPDHVSIKSFSAGGLDPWDINKYLNIWCGTFTGSEAGLLGVSTFPFTTDEGPQGVVIGIKTLPYVGNRLRDYYAEYSEGATLSHEIGHYFYLWHTFGDQSTCNNNDFQIQPGWPLPAGAGPEGDDTPLSKGTSSDNYVYGNPSMNYKDGCAAETFGMMYGSIMNYFDDRALFMFSDGMRKRIEGCINLYRPGLLTTDGATPPSAVNDAFLVDVTPRGLPERRSFVVNNTPLRADVRNTGTNTMTSVTLNIALDANAPATAAFPLNLSPGSDTTLDLGLISGTSGNHTLTIYTSSPSGGTDDFLYNDTLSSFINIDTASADLPFSEDFSSGSFPPTGWQVWNPNGGSTNTWARDGASGYTNPGAAFFDDYNIDEIGSLDELITPPLNIGTASDVQLNFKVAHAAIDNLDVSTWDGLEVYVSGDGGQSYHLVYKKSGKQLATAPVTTLAFIAPPSEPGKWRDETVDLSSYVVTGQRMIVKFRNTNAFGNNIYLDDINITSACASCTRDVQVLSINKPRGAECASNITPNATIKNKGIEIITGFSIAYSIDNGPVQATDVNGISLSRGDTISVSLPPVSGLSTGQHNIVVYTYNPVSPVGTGDELTTNDTLTKAFGIAGTRSAPLVETFESPTFPPSGWVVVNPDAGITWTRANTGKNSAASAYVNNYNYSLFGRVDDLYTPQITYSGVDSVSLSFDVAAASFGSPTDTLQVLLTKDCGNTFTSVYKKWGTNLQTVEIIQPGEFIPSAASEWRTETIDLTTIAPAGPAQIAFRNTNNNRNNIFIDNVTLKTRILPARLKREGLLILPNPFRNQFTVWHIQTPTDLRSISVYNTVGQLVWYKQYNGQASKQEVVGLSAASAGVYIVRVGYTDANHNVSLKIVKY
ncbi:MAG TPA: choice-of-anchor J domain-containing protein [Chitinophagaceae bacterium]|nr:choice-of-anchor J domain-containing protein [Chitinophagaceae bacterium]